MRDGLERLSEGSAEGGDDLVAALERLRVKSVAEGRGYLAHLLGAAVDEARAPDLFRRYSRIDDTYH